MSSSEAVSIMDLVQNFLDGEVPASLRQVLRKVEVREIGPLKLRSGRIVAVDPITSCNPTDPLDEEFEPGAYPVRVIAADQRAPPARVIAFVHVPFNKKPAARWRHAMWQGEPRFIGVDSHWAGLSDAMGINRLIDLYDDDNFFNVLQSQPDYYADDGEELASMELSEGVNLVAFTPGAGDGSYPVLIGEDADGAIVSLLVDCCMLDGLSEELVAHSDVPEA